MSVVEVGIKPYYHITPKSCAFYPSKSEALNRTPPTTEIKFIFNSEIQFTVYNLPLSYLSQRSFGIYRFLDELKNQPVLRISKEKPASMFYRPIIGCFSPFKHKLVRFDSIEITNHNYEVKV